MFLIYEINSGQVVDVRETVPSAENNYDYAVSDNFKAGDEFEYTIWIQSVDENKKLLSYSAIRNNPNAQRLLRETTELKADNADLWYENFIVNSELENANREIADLWYVILTNGGNE